MAKKTKRKSAHPKLPMQRQLNLQHEGGLSKAWEQLQANWEQSVRGVRVPAATGDIYCLAKLTIDEVKKLVRSDLTTQDPRQRARTRDEINPSRNAPFRSAAGDGDGDHAQPLTPNQPDPAPNDLEDSSVEDADQAEDIRDKKPFTLAL